MQDIKLTDLESISGGRCPFLEAAGDDVTVLIITTNQSLNEMMGMPTTVVVMADDLTSV